MRSLLMRRNELLAWDCSSLRLPHDDNDHNTTTTVMGIGNASRLALLSYRPRARVASLVDGAQTPAVAMSADGGGDSRAGQLQRARRLVRALCVLFYGEEQALDVPDALGWSLCAWARRCTACFGNVEPRAPRAPPPHGPHGNAPSRPARCLVEPGAHPPPAFHLGRILLHMYSACIYVCIISV